MNDLYLRLNYCQYKALEEQLKGPWDKLESSHRTVEGGYHKALRLRLTETLILEIQGPLIKPPLEE